MQVTENLTSTNNSNAYVNTVWFNVLAFGFQKYILRKDGTIFLPISFDLMNFDSGFDLHCIDMKSFNLKSQ